MSTEQSLRARSESKCELCGATDGLEVQTVTASPVDGADGSLFACTACRGQLDESQPIDPPHWRCLGDSMWSPVPAVQVTAWRMLKRLGDEVWAQDLLELLYLDDETLAWARAGMAPAGDADAVVHLDSHGATLQAGDTVTLTKDLTVKGAGFTAKRGTAVRNISLVRDNAGQIEGRVSGQQIVILTQFVKKSG